MADEEALLIVVGVDEPGGDALGVIRTDVAGIGIEDVDAVHFHSDRSAAVVEDFDVRLAEDDEHIAASGVLQLVRHMHVWVDARLEDFEASQTPQLGGMGVEVEGAGDQHVEARVNRLARGGDNILPADSAIFGTDQDRGAALGAVLALNEGAAGADEIAGPWRQALETDPVALVLLLDALGPEIVDDDRGEILSCQIRIGG